MTDITDFANFDLLPTAAPLLLMSMSGDTEWMAGLIGAFTAVNYACEGPKSIPADLTRIELINAGEKKHSLWAIKLDEGKSFDKLIGDLLHSMTEPAFPKWMAWYGGVTAGPDNCAAYTVDKSHSS